MYGVTDIYRGQRPVLVWICALKALKHMLRNPILRGNFAYHPEFAEDFSMFEFHHTIYYHLAQMECGSDSTVIVIYTNKDGAMTTSRHEAKLFYIRIANAKSNVCFDSSAVQLIACFPTISKEDEDYSSGEERKRAELQLEHDCIRMIFEAFNRASHQ